MSLADRLKSLSPRSQLVLAAMAVVVVSTILIASYFAMRPRYEVLFTDLRSADAATIVAKLEADKKPFRLAEGGKTILVPVSTVDETRLDVMSSDLPLKGTVGFELFNKSDMGLTEFAQRINYQRALQGELARTIMTIDGIDAARVHLTLPEPSIFRADRKPAKASVTLTMQTARALTPPTVRGVQKLVAASVPELEVADVAVLDEHGVLVSTAAGASEVPDEAAVVSPRLQQARAIEDYYAASIRQILEPVYADAHVKVLIAPDQWADLERDAVLARWTPADRRFGLQVEVSSRAEFSEMERRSIQAMVLETVGPSTAGTDLVVFPAWLDEAPVQTPAAYEPTASLAKPDAPKTNPIPSPLLALGGVIALLVLAGAAWVLRPRPQRRLTEAEREAFVRRLRRLLDDRAADAV